MTTLTTVNVAIAVQLIVGQPLPGGSVRFELTRADINGALIVPQAVTVALPADGSGVTAKLWPNTLGTQGSQTKVTVLDQAGAVQFSGLASIPTHDCNLHDVLNLTTPTVNDAQAAVNAARDWAQSATSPDGVNKSAKSYATDAGGSAAAASADRVLADADAAAAHADRVLADADVVTANASAAQAQSFFNRIYLGAF